MATFATDINLKNAAAANVPFTALNRPKADSVRYVDRSQGTFAGYNYVDLSVKAPSNVIQGVWRPTIKLTQAYVNATTGLQDCVGVVTVSASVPAKLTSTQKDELYARAKELIGLAVYGDAFKLGGLPT